MMKSTSQKQKGFTIMETLIAISLLLLAITGPMVFAQNALRAAFNARDQVTAFYLAQDAIEFVKNVRDDSILSNDPDAWLAAFNDCGTVGAEEGGSVTISGCSVDTSSGRGDIETCSSGTVGCIGVEDDASDDTHLKISNEAVIGHTGPQESVFSRTVYVDNIADETKITVRVRWKSHENIGVREITVVEYIYDWAGAILNQTE